MAKRDKNNNNHNNNYNNDSDEKDDHNDDDDDDNGDYNDYDDHENYNDNDKSDIKNDQSSKVGASLKSVEYPQPALLSTGCPLCRITVFPPWKNHYWLIVPNTRVGNTLQNPRGPSPNETVESRTLLNSTKSSSSKVVACSVSNLGLY
ncbi:hypothetical protein BZA77DRAFT_295177 [Pyronema omphalodes]|nr:hypothetical protein BZA77DRAFT_295177 [Pyronema omphalodes]